MSDAVDEHLDKALASLDDVPVRELEATAEAIGSRRHPLHEFASIFRGVAAAYQAMLRACQVAGTGHFHPHDLRHRRITIWHQAGVPARELAERAGHARPSMSLDVYSHVMPADEVAKERFQSLIRT